MGKPLVFNIQKFSTHDGDGVRTTIFFKGCPVHCRWCHNPESQRFTRELVYYHGKCKNCGSCIAHCPTGANSFSAEGKLILDREKCIACGNCEDWCSYQAREIAGREYTVDELVKKATQDQIFYDQSGGGVTLSGGEVMAQDMDFIEALCKKLKREGVSIYIDTCGFAPYEHYRRILPYVDVFLYDIKLLDPEAHREWIGVDNALILENLVRLSEDGAKIYIRIPTIGKVNATEEFMNGVISFLKEHGIIPAQVALLPYHSIGSGKYKNLDRDYDEDSMTVPDKATMTLFQDMFIRNGYRNTIIGG